VGDHVVQLDARQRLQQHKAAQHHHRTLQR
jgi:hypothetical protein